MRSRVISIFLYAYESWNLTAAFKKRAQAFEMRCYQSILNISYKDHVNNKEVLHFHKFLFSAALDELAKTIPVHSLLFFSFLFFCQPPLLFPFTVPRRIVFV